MKKKGTEYVCCAYCGKKMKGKALAVIARIAGKERYVCSNFCCWIQFVKDKSEVVE